MSNTGKQMKKHTNARKICAVIGREILRQKHKMNKYRNKSDLTSIAIYRSSCIEIATAIMLFTEAKLLI